MKSRGDAQRGIYDSDEHVGQGLCHQHIAGQPCTIHRAARSFTHLQIRTVMLTCFH